MNDTPIPRRRVAQQSEASERSVVQWEVADVTVDGKDAVAAPALTRKAAAAYLTAHGYPTAVTHLNNFAAKGGGPKFYYWANKTFYPPAELLAWAKRVAVLREQSTRLHKLKE